MFNLQIGESIKISINGDNRSFFAKVRREDDAKYTFSSTLADVLDALNSAQIGELASAYFNFCKTQNLKPSKSEADTLAFLMETSGKGRLWMSA